MNLQHRVAFDVVGVQVEELDTYWPVAEPLIQKALDRGSNYTIEQIREGLKFSNMQLWMYGLESALVTSIQSKAGKTWCLLLALGGKDMYLWFDHFPLLEEWAKDRGAQEMRVYGRIGWARYLKPSGYGVEWVKLSKPLE